MKRRPFVRQTRQVQTFRTPSGLGGAFKVSIVEAVNSEKVLVRIHYRGGDFDGHTFITSFNMLVADGGYAEVPA